MTNYNRIPTKSPWWHMDDAAFRELLCSFILGAPFVIDLYLVIA